MEYVVAADEVACDVAATFVRLADTLVDDYDVVDFASKLCRETRRLLDAAAAAVMLVAGPDELRVFASTSEDARALEFLEVRFDEGPSIDAYRTGSAVVAPDLTESLAARPERWGRFGRHAIQSGFRAVSAVPMWVRGTGIGALSLYDRQPRRRPAPDLALAEGLADIASIGILSAQRVREERVLAEQLQRALDSRVVIEQAKGTLAERFGVHVDEAFVAMRDRARSDRRHLSDVARDIVADRCHGQEFALPGQDATRRRATEVPSSA